MERERDLVIAFGRQPRRVTDEAEKLRREAVALDLLHREPDVHLVIDQSGRVRLEIVDLPQQRDRYLRREPSGIGRDEEIRPALGAGVLGGDPLRRHDVGEL